VGFGRRELQISAEDAYDYSLHQIGALDGFVRRRGIALSHIKPHGALYMMAARDDAVADGIARAARDFSPTLSVFALPNAALDSASRHYGLRVVAEFFADRPYVDGQVLMFGWTAEQIGSPDDAALRVKTMLGSELGDAIGTVCVHTTPPGLSQWWRPCGTCLHPVVSRWCHPDRGHAAVVNSCRRSGRHGYMISTYRVVAVHIMAWSTIR